MSRAQLVVTLITLASVVLIVVGCAAIVTAAFNGPAPGIELED